MDPFRGLVGFRPRNGGMAEWWNDGMAEWRNGGMAEWRNGRMAEWQIVMELFKSNRVRRVAKARSSCAVLGP